MPDTAEIGTIRNKDALKDVIGEPKPSIAAKEMPALDAHCLHFISLSPFLCIGTAGADGKADVSPRGDPPGFVQVIDDRTLLIPDRKGNRRVDTMSNILENPEIGLVFLLPGVEETLRVNGQATIVDDPAALAEMAVNGQPPALGIRVDIEHVFFHCAKALIRSKLWEPETRIDRKDFPTYGQIVRDQREPDKSAEEIDAGLQRDYKERLY